MWDPHFPLVLHFTETHIVLSKLRICPVVGLDSIQKYFSASLYLFHKMFLSIFRIMARSPRHWMYSMNTSGIRNKL